MGGGGGNITFKVNFSIDGIERLRNVVTDKLKEFMGDYTDDTLVEYVIVLLRNGRTKDEARNELNVFLGDEDSDSFVTWLWDHLSETLSLYVQSGNSCLNEAANKKSLPRDIGTSQGLQNQEYGPEKDRFDHTAEKVHQITENSHTKYAAKTSNLRSEIGQTHLEEKNPDKPDQTKRSLSPRPSRHRKRNRLDDSHLSEGNIGSLATTSPCSRLLQFAVREAVGTAGIVNKTMERNSKRIRSVVTTSAVDGRRRLRSVAMVSSIAGVALKAAAEAAEDVLRVRPSGSVFDRLGRGVDLIDDSERIIDFTDNVADGDHGFHDKVGAQFELNQQQVFKDGRRYASDKGMQSSKTEWTNHESEFAIEIDKDEIDDADALGYRNSSLFQTSTSVKMDEDSDTARHGMPASFYELKRKYQNQPSAVAHPSDDETINISAVGNIWKPPHISKMEMTGANASRVRRGGDVGDGTSGVHLLKENSVVGNGNGKSGFKTQLQKAPAEAPGSAGNVVSLEDADASTIFVSNVHFAATKDSLSRHFSKFGQVLCVTILTDAATGQPKGSAYIEFMQKETAEQATSLDGSSFMSRIIKVSMKGSAQPESTTPTSMAWPRAVPRGSPYTVPRFSRAPFPRGSQSSFRGRGIARPGARSLQWKRDAQPSLAISGVAALPSGINFHAPVRSLTYVRPELKAEGAST
ncbi:unnamed protein product [Rhodiola kirilowii]